MSRKPGSLLRNGRANSVQQDLRTTCSSKAKKAVRIYENNAAILYRRTGNCLISFIPHFLNNMIGFFLVPILFG